MGGWGLEDNTESSSPRTEEMLPPLMTGPPTQMRLLGALCILDSCAQVFSVETGHFTQAHFHPMDGETKAHPEEVTRDRARGAGPLPKKAHTTQAVQIPQRGKRSRGAESFETLPKKQGTDVCYWTHCFSATKLVLLPNIPSLRRSLGQR